jgi:hypothetical protein
MSRYGIREWCCGLGAALLVFTAPAGAQLLEDIDITPVGNEARVQLRFSAPVRYIRHFPPASGDIVHVTLQAMSMDESDIAPREHYKRSPKSDLVPDFTVRYSNLRDCALLRDPICLVIEFSRPVSYQVQMGTDSRSLLLFVLRATQKEKPEPGSNPDNR